MAEEEVTEDNGNGVDDYGEISNLRSLLASEDRDFLVRNNGSHVKISELEGKSIGLYFSGSWCGPCRRFTPILVEAYTELVSKKSNFEIIFVSADEDDEGFDDYFCKMPWLAIPFSDEDKRESLGGEFDLQGIPSLVILDEKGKVLTVEAVQVVRDYGAEGYPFTVEKIEMLKKEEEAAKINQTIKSLLATTSRDFVVTSYFKKIPITELEGKVVGLYFSLSSFEGCAAFSRRLVNVYNDLKGRGENFEIVLVSLEEDESSFMDDFEDMPWLGIPFKDKLCEKLVRYFELEDLPTLVVIGTNGKTMNVNAVEFVDDYGVDAYPFTSDKLKELMKKEKARIEAQTLESLLISTEKDYAIKNDGTKVPVLDLVGKNILLYFSAHWCPPCRAFLPLLTEVYNDIKERDDAFEIIFISSDQDEESFDDYFSHMPWLALPFEDERKRFLSRAFKISGIPTCVSIGPAGKTITKEARNLIMELGADAYPFTNEHIRQLKAELVEKAKQWPEKIRHKLHRHVLWKGRREYACDGCGKRGRDWSFHCKMCDFDLHPDCALDSGHEVFDSDDDDEEGWPKKIKHMLHKHVLVKAWRHYQCDACGVVKQGWSYFCEEDDFDIHPECAFGNEATYKVLDDSDDEEDDSDDDVDDESDNNGDESKYEDNKVEDNVDNELESLHRPFKKIVRFDLDDDEEEEEEDEEEEEEEESKKENSDKSEDNEDDEDEDKDKDNVKNDKEDDEDDEDGPEMDRYVCNTRDREDSQSFQESLFTCKLYK